MAQDGNIEKRVIESVGRVFKKNPSEISRDTRLVQDLFAKSIQIIELIAMLEYGFDIVISTESAKRAATVGAVVDLVASMTKKKN